MKAMDKLITDREATCYLADRYCIAHMDYPLQMRNQDEIYTNPEIRLISIDALYALVFGDDEAYIKLWWKLPIIIDDTLSRLSKN